MLPKAILASTDRLGVAAVRCAWSQWSSIGALTVGGPQIDNEIVDIESLILTSLGLARREPRLRTLATDWTVRNSGLVSIARLRALLLGPFAKTELEIGELAHVVSTTGGDARWRTLVKGSGDRVSRVAEAKPRMRKAVPPRWRDARTLLLQLRRGFGVGVKPDLLAILLGSRGAWVDVSTLSELSAYSVAGARRSADDMANAGLVETSSGHSRAFRANVSAWTALLPAIGIPIWRRRAEGFAFALHWQNHVQGKAASHDSELSVALSFSALMTKFWRLWLEAGITQEPVSDDPSNAWASRNVAIEALVRWFEDRAQYGDEYERGL